MQSKYEVLEVVGEGAFGIVMKCRNKETNEIVAIKKFKGIEEEIVQKSMIRELKALKRLKHDNIVQLKDCFKKKGQLYLAIEFLPLNLLQLLERHKNGLDQALIKKIMFQLSKALIYMHDNDLIHRDIKPENILLSEDNTVKLCDFGFARALPNGNGNGEGTALTDYVATRWYRAPELLLGVLTYGKEMDYWAMGCIMGELIDGRPLFPGDDELSQLNIIQSVIGNYPKSLLDIFYSNPRFVGSKLEDVVKPETIKRRYMGMISKSGISLLNCLLKLDPKERISGSDIINHPYFNDIREGGGDGCVGVGGEGNEGSITEENTTTTTMLNTKKIVSNTNTKGQIHTKTNSDNRFHKFKKITALKTKSPPNEMANLRLNIINPNANGNGNGNMNILIANHIPGSTTNNQKKTQNNHHSKHNAKHIHQHQHQHQNNNSLRCENNKANQQLLETFYHPRYRNDQYNFGIDTNFDLNHNHNVKEKKTNHIHSPSPNPYNTNNNTTNTIQCMQNEPKPQSKITKLFKPFHLLDDMSNLNINLNCNNNCNGNSNNNDPLNKFNFNFLPQINPSNRSNNKTKEEINFSNYKY